MVRFLQCFHHAHICYFVHIPDTSSVSICGVHCFTHKTICFSNIFNKNRFLQWRFAPTNATKYLFCCVRYWGIQEAPVFCPHGVDWPEWPGTSTQGPNRLTHSRGRSHVATGGGGNAEPAARRVSPSTTRKNKKSLSKNLPKNKKAKINFIKAPFGRHCTNFILHILLTIKYI